MGILGTPHLDDVDPPRAEEREEGQEARHLLMKEVAPIVHHHVQPSGHALDDPLEQRGVGLVPHQPAVKIVLI
jgi:hypothetical protein